MLWVDPYKHINSLCSRCHSSVVWSSCPVAHRICRLCVCFAVCRSIMPSSHSNPMVALFLGCCTPTPGGNILSFLSFLFGGRTSLVTNVQNFIHFIHAGLIHVMKRNRRRRTTIGTIANWTIVGVPSHQISDPFDT
jgi:hypothetical protein